MSFKNIGRGIILSGCFLKSLCAIADINTPLPFAFDTNNIIRSPIEIEYELDEVKKDSLKMGPFNFSEKTFYLILKEPKNVNPAIEDFKKKAFDKKSLFMSVPSFFQGNIKLEMISKTGFVIWRNEVKLDDMNEWNDFKKKLKAATPEKKTINLDPFKAVIWDVGAMGLNLEKIKDSFRFCLSTDKDKMQMNICTSYYGVKKSNANFTLAKVKTSAHARVLAQGEEVPLKGNVGVQLNETASFYAELQTGETLQFVTPIKKIPLVDAIRNKEGTFKVVFSDLQPYGDAQLLNAEDTESLVHKIGFASTIGDFRKFWSSEVQDSNPSVFLPGEAGGIFKVTLQKEAIPIEEVRPKIEENTLRGTYGSTYKIFGKKFKDSKISSQEESVEIINEEEDLFRWYFKADKKGQLNKSYLTVEAKGQNFKNYFEVYRGFANELSLRLSAILTPGSFVINGEMAFNHWFEDIFGWSNSLISRQRWGFSYKYFQSITKSSTNESSNFSMMTSDLKYRLSPGLWGRDESVGLIMSYQDMTYGASKSKALGYGGFWARSMPQVFDNIFNIFPWFRYDKWVDMEVIVYPTSLLSTTKILRNYAINFHGKIMWTDNFFGEAGFGRKEFMYSDTAALSEARMETFYGTFGMGLNF